MTETGEDKGWWRDASIDAKLFIIGFACMLIGGLGMMGMLFVAMLVGDTVSQKVVEGVLAGGGNIAGIGFAMMVAAGLTAAAKRTFK